MKQLLFIFALLLGMTAQADPGDEMTVIWDRVLKRHVTTDGRVDYAGIKVDKEFSQVVSLFQKQIPDGTWTKNESLAYWMNAYNVFAIKLVVDHYPVKSINDIDNPWKQKTIKIAGKSYSLDQIENEIIRPTFKDARIHFGINCASESCPPISRTAFTGTNVNSELDRLARAFMKDTKRNKFQGSSAQVSKIFEWFSVDFEKEGGVIAFMKKHGANIENGANLSYLDYDWSLNSK
ncbi:DUF547 domain-containing protein [Sanyastnella coralliicola]|uniref:DUF547 domain-containing protein n=1 Tax=Sanyastnella coralliicola TaxID=3069118 RepID=UPI0027B9EC43|nr:DUF547 domain-containing protein [Longitalea sp. SCSIO 12813]